MHSLRQTATEDEIQEMINQVDIDGEWLMLCVCVYACVRTECLGVGVDVIVFSSVV